jgi:hypothetical protein
MKEISLHQFLFAVYTQQIHPHQFEEYFEVMSDDEFELLYRLYLGSVTPDVSIDLFCSLALAQHFY